MPPAGGVIEFSVSWPVCRSSSLSNRLIASERPFSLSTSNRNPVAGTPSGGPDCPCSLIREAVSSRLAASLPSNRATRACIGSSSDSVASFGEPTPREAPGSTVLGPGEPRNRRLDPQQPGRPLWEPPIPPSEQRHHRRDEQRPDHRRVEQNARG